MCKTKILTLILSLTVAISATVNYKDVFATDSTNTEITALEDTYSSFNEVCKPENIGATLCVKGVVVDILDKTIIIEDSSTQLSVVVENFETNDIAIGDNIFAKGVVTKLSDSEEQVLLIQSPEDIGILVLDDNDNTSQDDDTNQDDDNDSDKDNNNQNNNVGNTNDNNANGNNNSTNNSGNGSGSLNNNNKPNVNSNSSNNYNTNNYNTNNNVINNSSSPSSNNVSTTTATISKISSKTVVTISDDLSEAQWEKINSALEEGLIKIKDLPNNKLKIVQVLEDSGDKVWIVNDPEKSDTEETEDEFVFTVGYDLINSLDYANFDVTENKWSSIIEDIQSGIAKAKLTDDGDLKIIYIAEDDTDTIVTISKLSS